MAQKSIKIEELKSKCCDLKLIGGVCELLLLKFDKWKYFTEYLIRVEKARKTYRIETLEILSKIETEQSLKGLEIKIANSL